MRSRTTRVLLVAAFIGTAGCTSSKLPAVDHPGLAQPVPLTSAQYAAQARERLHQSTAYAEQMVAATPQVPGRQPLTGPPPPNVRQPNETIGVDNLVVRAGYWTAPGSADRVYRELKHASVPGFRLTGYGRPSSPAEDVGGRGFVHFDPVHLPSSIEGGELYIEMEADASGDTVIAAFGEAYAHPPREAEETIPVAGSTVVIARQRAVYPKPEVVGRVSLDTSRSEAFVRAFDAAPVHAPGQCIGGLGPAFVWVVTITSGDRAWTINYPGGSNCGGLGVSLAKKPLPDVQPTALIRRLLATDYMGSKGMVDGTLSGLGGPAGNRAYTADYRGEVMVTRHGRVVATTRAGRGGAFEVTVPPGRYLLTGRSPHYNGGRGRCQGLKPITVKADRISYTYVACQLK